MVSIFPSLRHRAIHIRAAHITQPIREDYELGQLENHTRTSGYRMPSQVRICLGRGSMTAILLQSIRTTRNKRRLQHGYCLGECSRQGCMSGSLIHLVLWNAIIHAPPPTLEEAWLFALQTFRTLNTKSQGDIFEGDDVHVYNVLH